MVRFAVKVGVHRDILDAEISAEINHPQAGIQKRASEFMGHTVGKREKNKLRTAANDVLHMRGDEGEIGVAHPGEPWKNLCHRLPCELAGGECDKLRMRVPDQEADQLFSRIPAGSHHGDFSRC
jgi:hypothetical protein